MAKPLPIYDLDRAVGGMGNKDSAGCLVYITVIKATWSGVGGKFDLSEQLQRH